MMISANLAFEEGRRNNREWQQFLNATVRLSRHFIAFRKAFINPSLTTSGSTGLKQKQIQL
jgi:hypothetical protein